MINDVIFFLSTHNYHLDTIIITTSSADRSGRRGRVRTPDGKHLGRPTNFDFFISKRSAESKMRFNRFTTYQLTTYDVRAYTPTRLTYHTYYGCTAVVGH